MIWFWIGQYIRAALSYIGILLIPPPKDWKSPVVIVPIDLNAACPSCGHTSGKIKAVPKGPDEKLGVQNLHLCNVCGAKWHENAVVADTEMKVYPAE